MYASPNEEKYVVQIQILAKTFNAGLITPESKLIKLLLINERERVTFVR